MKAIVYLESTTSLAVQVEIPDDTPEDEREEVAIDAAHDNAPRSVCAQCSGWGKQWSRDDGEWVAIDDSPVRFDGEDN